MVCVVFYKLSMEKKKKHSATYFKKNKHFCRSSARKNYVFVVKQL